MTGSIYDKYELNKKEIEDFTRLMQLDYDEETLILVTKYRKKLFNGRKITDDLKQFIFKAVQKYDSKTIQMETDKYGFR